MNERDEALLGLQGMIEGRFRSVDKLVKAWTDQCIAIHGLLCAACERISTLERTINQHVERIEQLEGIVEAIGPGPETERVYDLAGDEVDLGKLATDNTWSEDPSGINLNQGPPRP